MRFCVPTKIAAILLSCFAFVCFSAIVDADEAGKLYCLEVWGGGDDMAQYVAVCQFHYFFIKQRTGISKTSMSRESDYVNFCSEEIILAKRNESRFTNDDVLEACRYFGQKAGKNDVIFVYMCCHAKTARLDGDSKRYHVLFPCINDVSDMDNFKNGIKRSDIIKALNPQAHRLTVLITDASTCDKDNSAKPVKRYFPLDRGIGFFGNNRLITLLQTNTGLIDWNSTSPLGGLEKQGEYISIYQFGRGGSFDSAPSPRNIFMEAFQSYSCGEPDKKSISAQEFFVGLKKELAEEFDQSKNNVNESDKATYSNQPTQTLFNFKGLGYVTK